MKKYELGYTTGVFDMFHIGHLNILRNAKDYCECLIVGVSTDELVRTYKHKTPVIPFEERKAIVEAIRYVDRVVPQVSMDKLAAWKELRYEAIFHGDDWRGSEMYDAVEKQLKAVGVETVFLPYTQETSSTMLKDALQKILESR